MTLYRTALDRAGKPFPTELPMMREVCIADTHAEAVRLARPYLEQKYKAYVEWGQHKALPGDDDMTQSFEALARDRFILGDPSECADELQRCAEVTGATTMLLRLQWPGMPHEVITKSMRLLMENVAHRL
jgi:alkanesulfonate monooxygenase SsuD/methylene tetrahydromethanopterin reductase-like flavin-dependent oxidoreductase (luciferase family)